MNFFLKKKPFKYSFYLFAFVLVGIILYPLFFSEQGKTSEELNVKEVNYAIEKKLVFITRYVIGSDTIETKVQDINSLEDLSANYPEFQIYKFNEEEVVLERTIEDLAPELKEGSYFSLDQNGYLTLYHDNKTETRIIETFFRIDIEKMETGLPKEPVEQLFKGIPIQDLAEYNSVLSTFSEYSLEE